MAAIAFDTLQFARRLFTAIDVQFAQIKGEFRLVYWMLAIIIASTVTPYLQKLFGLLAG